MIGHITVGAGFPPHTYAHTGTSVRPNIITLHRRVIARRHIDRADVLCTRAIIPSLQHLIFASSISEVCVIVVAHIKRRFLQFTICWL